MTKKSETVKEELKEDINKNLKEEILEELNEEIERKIKTSISNELEKTNKKIIREKNRKIIIRNLIIILLLFVIVYLLYLLKKANYFDQYFNNNNNGNNEIVEQTNEEKPEEKVPEEKGPTLKELKEQYQSLLNNLYLNESSNYTKNLYNGELLPEIKQYFTMNVINQEGLTIDDNYNVIDNLKFKNTYEKLFNDTYVPTSFEYNDVDIRYLSKLESYVTDKLITENTTNIIKEIIDIKVTDNNIIITTIEGLLKDNKVYNIINGHEICQKDKITANQDKLNKLTYTFSKDNKLLNIAK